MTCIVGVTHMHKVYIGGDSAGANSYFQLQTRKDPKVFRTGEFVIGFTSSFRMGQVLRFKFTPPLIPPAMDLYDYMVTHFVEAVRSALKEGGYTTIHENEEKGGTFLVGIRGRLFEIQGDFQVAESLDDFMACGCGDDLALGALHSTPGIPPRDRVENALSAAARFSAGVRPPFVILET